MRINLSQAFNGVGTVVAPVLGSYVFFTQDPNDPKALQNVQWVYLAIACFVFLLAGVFYFSDIPEITDADMAFQAQETHNEDVKPFRKQYRLFHAAFAQFCYTGAQVAVASYFINYVTETRRWPADFKVERKFSISWMPRCREVEFAVKTANRLNREECTGRKVSRRCPRRLRNWQVRWCNPNEIHPPKMGLPCLSRHGCSLHHPVHHAKT